MEIPQNLVSLFTGNVLEQNGEYYVSVPNQQVTKGALDQNKQYRIALIEVDESQSTPPSSQSTSGRTSNSRGRGANGQHQFNADGNPPVDEGDQVTVEIESTGDKGDGIAKVEGGYVIVVENGNVGEKLTVQIDTVKPNYAFANVVNSAVDESTASA